MTSDGFGTHRRELSFGVMVSSEASNEEDVEGGKSTAVRRRGKKKKNFLKWLQSIAFSSAQTEGRIQKVF